MKEKNIREIIGILGQDGEINKYQIFDYDEILSQITFNCTKSNLLKILKLCETDDYINIKYTDDKVFCVCLTNLGKQFYNSYENQQNSIKKIKLEVVAFLFFVLVLAFLGSFLGILFYNIVFV